MAILAGALLLAISLWLASRLADRLGDSLSCGVLPATFLGCLLAAVLLGMAVQSGGGSIGRQLDMQAVQIEHRLDGVLGKSSGNHSVVRIVPVAPPPHGQAH